MLSVIVGAAMRQYGSFVVRWWALGAERQRLHILHVQSDTELIVAALPEALAWMRDCVIMADRAPPPGLNGKAIPTGPGLEEPDEGP